MMLGCTNIVIEGILDKRGGKFVWEKTIKRREGKTNSKRGKRSFFEKGFFQYNNG